MKRWFVSTVLALCVSSAAQAHFVFVVPEADGAKAKIFISETLEPDAAVDADIIRDTKITARDIQGHESPMPLAKGEHWWIAPLPDTGRHVIHGTTDLGITTRGATKPYVLIYHPKTIVGEAFSAAPVGKTPIEIVPQGKIGAVKLQLLVDGKPKADAEIDVLLPDGSEKKITTDKNGLTEALEQEGRYGAWARYWDATPGERDGKKYDETRHYATLVFDAGKSHAAATQAAAPAGPKAVFFTKMPEAASSFGAVADAQWLYVYGGHIAPTHVYSTEAVSGKFNRLNLAHPDKWEALPAGPAVQGMNLAIDEGKIYRIGGMQPRNKPGDPEDIFSIADCARFDPATQKWEALPPLPAPRSSHDVAIIDHVLYVVGGWNLKGQADTEWATDLLAMDLRASKPTWKSLEQPFKRRAIIAAVHQGKLFVLGGFDDNSEMVKQVQYFDPAKKAWANGPDLPGPERNAFSPAACELEKHLYVSVANGALYRLNEAGDQWQEAGSGTPRIVHRLVPKNGEILVIGGAAQGTNLDLIESISPLK